MCYWNQWIFAAEDSSRAGGDTFVNTFSTKITGSNVNSGSYGGTGTYYLDGLDDTWGGQTNVNKQTIINIFVICTGLSHLRVVKIKLLLHQLSCQLADNNTPVHRRSLERHVAQIPVLRWRRGNAEILKPRISPPYFPRTALAVFESDPFVFFRLVVCLYNLKSLTPHAAPPRRAAGAQAAAAWRRTGRKIRPKVLRGIRARNV